MLYLVRISRRTINPVIEHYVANAATPRAAVAAVKRGIIANRKLELVEWNKVYRLSSVTEFSGDFVFVMETPDL